VSPDTYCEHSVLYRDAFLWVGRAQGCLAGRRDSRRAAIRMDDQPELPSSKPSVQSVSLQAQRPVGGRDSRYLLYMLPTLGTDTVRRYGLCSLYWGLRRGLCWASGCQPHFVTSSIVLPSHQSSLPLAFPRLVAVAPCSSRAAPACLCRTGPALGGAEIVWANGRRGDDHRGHSSTWGSLSVDMHKGASVLSEYGDVEQRTAPYGFSSFLARANSLRVGGKNVPRWDYQCKICVRGRDP
jgi:hypothetical protein